MPKRFRCSQNARLQVGFFRCREKQLKARVRSIGNCEVQHYKKMILILLLLLSFILFIKFKQSKQSRMSSIKMPPLPISAGILTFRDAKTLRHTLLSYAESGFLDLVDCFVVIQKSEMADEEEAIAREFGLRFIRMPNNGRMASGFKAIYNHALHDTLLLLENDFTIRASQAEVVQFLTDSLAFLQTHDVVRGRSRYKSGEPNYARQQLRGKNMTGHPKLCECIYWDAYPERYSEVTKLKHGWYASSSKYCNYTNNPFLCKKDFFLKEIYPHLVDGENIEDRLTDIWATKDYRCVFGPGLFTHHRINFFNQFLTFF
jgi:hypothetical protein